MKNFISFEGGEGSGKTTQSKLLFKSISKITKDVLLTREPGGNNLSEKIRSLIVKKNNDFDSITELLLIYASRNEHITKVIKPYLKIRKIIVCDRFIDSTYAYQITGQNISKKYFKFLNNMIVKKVIPEHTFIIKINPEIGIKRSLERKNKEVKYEHYDLDFHKKVMDAYIEIANKNKRCLLIDGDKDIKTIHKIIIDHLNSIKFLKKKIPYYYA